MLVIELYFVLKLFCVLVILVIFLFRLLKIMVMNMVIVVVLKCLFIDDIIVKKLENSFVVVSKLGSK